MNSSVSFSVRVSLRIDPGLFTGTRTRAEGYPGILKGEGGVVFGGSPLLAYAILRMLLQDKNPSWHILGGKRIEEIVTHRLVRQNLYFKIRGGAIPRRESDPPSDVDTFPPETDKQEPGETSQAD